MSAVLSGLEEEAAVDSRACASFIGTSAGSIVAAALAAGVRPRARLGRLAEERARSRGELAGEPSQLTRTLRALLTLGATTAAPLASAALGWRATTAAGALLRRELLARVPTGRRSLDQLGVAVERLGVHWDGRLQIAAVELESGRRVMFGSAGAPRVPVSSAVQASCAIPGVFRPVRTGDRTYIDGGVWSPTNMDAAKVTRGAHVLCLNPTGSIRPSPRAPAGALGTVSRSIASDPLALLIGFALDQQVTVQQAFLGPLRLRERLGALDAATLATADLEQAFRQKPAVHRFPGKMAERVRALALHVRDEYDGDA